MKKIILLSTIFLLTMASKAVAQTINSFNALSEVLCPFYTADHIEFNVTGGTSPYTYSITDGGFFSLSGTSATGTEFFDGVGVSPVSTLTLTITDAASSVVTATTVVSFPGGGGGGGYSVGPAVIISDDCNNFQVAAGDAIFVPSPFGASTMPMPTSFAGNIVTYSPLPDDYYLSIDVVGGGGGPLSVACTYNTGVINPLSLAGSTIPQNPSVYALNNGKITVPASYSGVTNSYTFTYTATSSLTGSTTFTPSLVGSNYEFTNLYAGTYTITQTYSPGTCVKTHVVTLYDPPNLVTGTAKVDLGGGCGASDPAAIVSVNANNGTTSVNGISNSAGVYLTGIPAFSYTLTPAAIMNPSYYTISPSSAVITFPPAVSPATQNFCLTPVGVHHNLAIAIYPYDRNSPGFNTGYIVAVTNTGNQIDNGCFTFTYDNTVQSYVSASFTPSSTTANSVSYCTPNINPTQTVYYYITLINAIPPTLNGGDYTTTSASILMNTNIDEDLVNNATSSTRIVLNSYDPNNKICAQGNTILPSQVANDLNYTINFENTGSGPAVNITVKDFINLSQYDISTLVPGVGSAPFTTTIVPPNEVNFTFAGINLPATPGSNTGYLTFSIKPISTLGLGDSVKNRAEIYFDFNSAVITDYATTYIDSNLCGSGLTVTTIINDSTVCEGDSIHINTTVNGVINPTTGYTYTWYDYTSGIWDTMGYLTPNLDDVAGEAGSYLIAIEVMANGAGCKDTAYFSLAIGNVSKDTLHVTQCNSFTWTNGTLYTSSGFYTQTFTTANGCDSIKVLDLTITSSGIICDTTFFNVSTGSFVDLSGNDVLWQDVINGTLMYIPPSSTPISWEPTPVAGTNANWINHAGNPGNSTMGIHTFERAFNTITAENLILDFKYAADDSMISMELESPSGILYPIATPNLGLLLSPTVTTASTIIGEIGIWKLRATVHFWDIINGFLLSGNILQVNCDTVCCPVTLTEVQASSNGFYCINDTVKITALVNGVDNASGYNYQWYYSTLFDATFISFGTANGANTSTYEIVHNTGYAELFMHLVVTQPNGICKDTLHTGYFVNEPALPDTLHVLRCNSYTWTNGITYTTPGYYSQTFADMFGCDSIKVLDYKQGNLVCDTTKINISTGIDSLGNALPITSIDPFWVDVNLGVGSLRATNYASGFWIPTPISITNARWINHTGVWNGLSNPFSTTVPFVMDRNFNITSSVGELIPDFGFTADDNPISIELEDPSGLIYPLTIPTAPAYYLGASVSSSIPVVPVIGTWKIRATVLFYDNGNGFLVSGNMLQLNCDTTCCTECIADSINLSTGIDMMNNVMASPGNLDPHWTIPIKPAFSSPGSAAYTVATGSWANPSPTSGQYINADGIFDGEAAGNYIYERLFTVCDSGNFILNYTALADNDVSILVDGTLISTTAMDNYGFLLANAATAVNVPIALSAGTHKIVADVYNQGSYSGFLFIGSIKPDTVFGGTLQMDSCVITAAPLSVCGIKLVANLENQIVHLNWDVVNEFNLINMIIEKSSDGINYKTIQELKPQNLGNYAITDMLSADDCNKKIYYRINGIKTNQKQVFSNLTEVKCISSQDISIFPNPAKDVFSIITNLKVQEIELYNLHGQLIQNWKYNTTNNYKLQNIAQGNYFVKIKTKQNTYTQKLIVN
jgi:hypothetical protein